MTVVEIDDREPPALFAALDALGIAYTKKRQTLGDINFYTDAREPLLFVERKCWSDFAQSQRNGRFWHQRQDLLDAAATGVRVALLTEAATTRTWTDETRGVPDKAVDCGLISTTLFRGLPHVRTKDVKHTAGVVGYIAKKLESPDAFAPPSRDRLSDAGRTHTAKARTMEPRDTWAAMLQVIPGVSKKRARAVADAFSMHDLVEGARKRYKAAEDPMANLDCGGRKLGPAVAKRIWAFASAQAAPVSSQ